MTSRRGRRIAASNCAASDVRGRDGPVSVAPHARAAARLPRALALARHARRACAMAALLVVGGNAHAGLFDDDEARRAIIDLRTRISQLEDANKSQGSQDAHQLQQL